VKSSSDEVVLALRVILAHRALERDVDKETLITWAMDALAAGLDSESLVLLAGSDPSRDHRADVEGLFDQTLLELRIKIPDSNVATAWLAKHLAEQIILSESAKPSDYGPQVSGILAVWTELGYPAYLLGWHELEELLEDPGAYGSAMTSSAWIWEAKQLASSVVAHRSDLDEKMRLFQPTNRDKN
jgi:hypothetical protein